MSVTQSIDHHDDEPQHTIYLPVITRSSLFAKLSVLHVNGGHCGEDKTWKSCRRNYTGTSQAIVRKLVQACPVCALVRTEKRQRYVTPIEQERTLGLLQIDLIDMRSQPDGPWHWIFHGILHKPHFNFLFPQETKKGRETLSNLKLLIFQHGFVPDLIQADSGKEFKNKKMEAFALALTGKAISHGKPRDPRPQGMVEQAHSTAYSRLIALQAEMRTKSWAELLPYTAFLMNINDSRGVKLQPSAAYHNTLLILREGFLTDASWREGMNTYVPVQTYRASYHSDLEDDFVITPETATAAPAEEDEWPEDFESDEDPAEKLAPGLVKQANVNRSKARQEMVRRNGRKLAPLPVGAVIKLEIPKEDRGKLAFKWLLGRVFSISYNGNYKIITEHGLIKALIQRKHLFLTKISWPGKESEKPISLIAAFRKASGYSVTGSTRCGCKTGCKKTCGCVKAKIPCTIACHKDKAYLCTNHAEDELKVERPGIPKIPKDNLKFPISIFPPLSAADIEQAVQIADRCNFNAPKSSIGTRIGTEKPYDKTLRDIKNIKLRIGDMLRLLTPMEWINDELVNIYFFMIEETHPDQIFAFDSYAYEKANKKIGCQYRYRAKELKQVNPFEKRFMLFPLHLSSHWSLAIFDSTEWKVIYYDSLGFFQTDLGFITTLLSRVYSYHYKKKKMPPFKEERISEPVQENGHDCGVFIMIFARVYTDPSYLPSKLFKVKAVVHQSHIRHYREYFLLEFHRQALIPLIPPSQ